MEAFLEEFQHLKIQLEEIMSATNNFDYNNVIGRGGFGRVYEGTISHAGRKSMVAFKRLDRRYGQGDPEFLKEILMLSRYVHVNLISLLGFCEENGEKILVYELASHGSLDCHLSSTNLTWMQRLKICLAAARGLSYLHDPKETQQRVIHRDIKSSNILLDENWNAKVSDMGLSKIGPANQSHSFLATNVVGTWGYIDPMYFQTSILTKESDVYSFGVVLFEVLCGRLCYENNNGRILTLAQTWRKSYKQKRLDDIIFQNLKQHMDLSSLETFSDLAYQCLQKYREERPKMSEVVEKLEIALRFQESFEDVEPVMDYKEMCKSVSPSQPCRSQDQLKMVLSNGILINNQKTWFSVNKNGDHSEMISAAGCLIPIDPQSTEYVFYGREKSRFAMGYCRKFKTNVRTQYLSPNITYTVNLVFQLQSTCKEFLGLNYILSGETRSSTLYIAYKRKDRWLRAELYQFTSERRDVNMEITFECRNQLAVGGIEFQPLERHQVLEDEEVDMQHISHSATFWEQKLPTDYEDIIKWSKDSLQWKTKKDLYSVLCEGFPINNGEEWFSLAKNGKKCHMLSARMALQTEEWRWQCLSTSRFREVAIDPDSGFLIHCILERMQLNFFTTYETYLVYKLQENDSIFKPPVEVSLTTCRNRSWYIYLLSPQTPIIRGSMCQDTRNLINKPKIRGLPQQRNNGWMEVQVWKFRTGGTIARISKDLQLKFYDNRQFKGLIVQGLEFKPI